MTAATLESTVKVLLAWIMSRCEMLCTLCVCVCVCVGKTAMIFEEEFFVCEEVRFLSVYFGFC